MKEMGDKVEISGEGAAKAANESASPLDGSEPRMDEEIVEELDLNDGKGDEDVLRNELNETKDRLLRQAAEFQNYRRRTEQEKNMLVKAGKEQVIQRILDVFDDFSRSVEATRQIEANEDTLSTPYLKLREGVEMVYEKFHAELQRMGVEAIEAVGKSFNENEHEALLQQPAPDDTAPGTVLEEIQKGYRMGDKILRHSRVIVAS